MIWGGTSMTSDTPKWWFIMDFRGSTMAIGHDAYDGGEVSHEDDGTRSKLFLGYTEEANRIPIEAVDFRQRVATS